MNTNKQKIYNNYLIEIEKAITEDNLDNLDLLLENIYTSNISEEIFIEIDELLQEATLYLEFKENIYKERFLELISVFKWM